MALPSSPNDRKEVYLSNIAGQGTALPSEPHDRYEAYLDYIAKNGGGGGTGEGDMTKAVYDGDLAVAGAGGIADYVAGAITGKVDKVNGKGLSSNDYDDSAKAIVDGVNTALDGKVSKSNTAGLLKNDGTVDQTSYATAASVTAIKDGTTIDSFGDVESALANKVDKVSGKGLSTNDYDATAKSKLDNLANIKSIGTGLDLDASGELTATGAGITIDSAMSSSSTNPVQNKVITNALAGKASVDNVKANTQLIVDTVGWSGKNKLKHNVTSGSDNGCTHTVNADRSITYANAPSGNFSTILTQTLKLPAGKWVLSGLTGGSTTTIYMQGFGNVDYTSGQGILLTNGKTTFTLTAENTIELRIYVRTGFSGSKTIYPMIISADILDDTYEPYRNTTAFPRGNELSSSDDLNNITEDGIYFFSTHPTNGPEAIANGTLIVNKGASGFINQMVISTGRMYTRSYNPEPGQGWYSWYGYIGTSS